MESEPKTKTESNNRPKTNEIAIPYPKRPRRDNKVSSKFKTMTVICNLHDINLGTNQKKVLQYAIHYDPPIAEDNYPLKRKIFRQLRPDLDKTFGKHFQAGDSLFVYCNDPQDKVCLETEVLGNNYKVEIVRTPNYINCRNINKKTSDSIKIKSFLESIIKNMASANELVVQMENRAYYNARDSERFGRGNAKILRGFSTAICLTENGLALRINDKNKMITGKTALAKIQEIADRFGGNVRNQECMDEIRDYFKGRTVVAMYGKCRGYRITDINFDRTVCNTEFQIKGSTDDNDGKPKTMSLKDYYKQQYNISVKKENQPLLIEEEEIRKIEPEPKKENKEGDSNSSNDSNKIVRYLIPELVYLTGIDELDESEKKEITTKSQLFPGDKIKRIEQGLEFLTNKNKKKVTKKNGATFEKLSPYEIMEQWGINIDKRFVEVQSKCLPSLDLIFQDKTVQCQLSRGRFKQQKDFLPKNFDNNNCMLITLSHLENLARSDCNGLSSAGAQYGVRFDVKDFKILRGHNKEEVMEELKRINYNCGKEIAIVVLDHKTKFLYPFIKDFLYSQGGITSQFMLHDEKPGGKKKQNMSYYGAVLNQMVVKDLGELFRINFCQAFSKVPSMIIGIDSSRGKNGETKYVLSASYNRFYNKFFTDIKTGRTLEDKPINFLLRSAIDSFKNSNNQVTPANIIIYRQGGNERQIERLKRDELPQITDLLGNGGYAPNYKPKLTIFSVNKNSDLKFFSKQGNKYFNLPTGSVIDDKVISPDIFEFYLQCPEVMRGSASPVHFMCIYNNNEDLTIEDFEEISLKQSYYYWNWPGPVRIPAALKYAEVANAFSSKNLKNEVLVKLKKSPYYI